MNSAGVQVEFDDKVNTPSGIRRLADIPNVQTLEIPPVDFLVPGMIARNTITVWTGACGTGKSFIALAMGVAVATGASFWDAVVNGHLSWTLTMKRCLRCEGSARLAR